MIDKNEPTNLFHFDKEALTSTVAIVLLFNLPQNRSDQEERQEASGNAPIGFKIWKVSTFLRIMFYYDLVT